MAKRSLVFFHFFSIFSISSRPSGLFPVRNAYPGANKPETPTLERHTLERNAYMFPREAPTLELPWSDIPIYACAYPAAAYPRAYVPTLDLPWSGLPWTYPRAETPALPRLPGRLPRRTWPFFPSSSSLPAALPPPPPRAPQGPRVSQKPPAPAYPGARPGPWPGPSRGLRTGGRPGRPGLGSRSNSHFPQKEFVWETGQIDSRLNGRGEPTLELPWSPRARTSAEANPDERQRPARG